MEYRLLENLPANNTLIILLLIGVVFFVSFLIALPIANNAIVGTLCITSIITISLSLILIFQEREKRDELDEVNKTVATENLKLKYDIKNADWNSKDTTATPKDTVGENNLIIEGNNDKTYVFKYKVKLETGEPILGDMPIAGGSSPQDAVTAESLLKNK